MCIELQALFRPNRIQELSIRVDMSFAAAALLLPALTAAVPSSLGDRLVADGQMVAADAGRAQVRDQDGELIGRATLQEFDG